MIKKQVAVAVLRKRRLVELPMPLSLGHPGTEIMQAGSNSSSQNSFDSFSTHALFKLASSNESFLQNKSSGTHNSRDS